MEGFIKLTGILSMLLLMYNAPATSGYFPAGGRPAAMAHASVTLADPWGICNNQAGIAHLKAMTFGFYAENRYLLKELGLQAGFILIPAKTGVVGLSLVRFGYASYSENKVGLAFARGFGQRFAAGLQLDYIGVFSKEKEYRINQVTFEAGLITHITPDLLLAVHLFNPLTLVVKKPLASDSQNAVIRMGIGYLISGKIVLSLQAQKEPVTPVQFMAGFEYTMTPSVCFRSGVTTQPVQVTFGTGYHWHKLYIDFSACIHQQLGWYPQLSIHFMAQ